MHDLTRQAASQHLANGATWAASPRGWPRRATSSSPHCRRRPMSRRSGLARTGWRPASAKARRGSTCPPMRSTWCAGCTRGWPSRAWISSTRRSAAVRAAPSSGRLAIWVGGDKPAFEKIPGRVGCDGRPGALYRAIGAGTIAKLTHNCAGAAINTVLAEVFTMGVKAGVEPLALWEAIRQGATGRQRSFDRSGRAVPARPLRASRLRAAAAAQGCVAGLAAWPRSQRTDAAVQPGTCRR